MALVIKEDKTGCNTACFALQYVPFRIAIYAILESKTASVAAENSSRRCTLIFALSQAAGCVSVADAHEILAYFRPEDFNFRIIEPCEAKSNKKSESGSNPHRSLDTSCSGLSHNLRLSCHKVAIQAGHTLSSPAFRRTGTGSENTVHSIRHCITAQRHRFHDVGR